jgi:LmbE family N-acetylglucosaminyl deacetylase
MGEWLKSMKILKPETCSIKDFETRKFNYNRQEILDLLIQYKDFDYVFTHSANDFHADHKTVGEESIRAFKHTNLITYLGEWNQRTQTKNYFIELHKSNVDRKLEALKCYFSQSGKPYMHPDYIWANVLNNGVICNTKYAEAFEVINFVE